jgi:hypothetical protein
MINMLARNNPAQTIASIWWRRVIGHQSGPAMLKNLLLNFSGSGRVNPAFANAAPHDC